MSTNVNQTPTIVAGVRRVSTIKDRFPVLVPKAFQEMVFIVLVGVC